MTHVANIVIDHTKVAADLTDFTVSVDLNDLPDEFWDTVAEGGGDIRVYKSDGTTELPRDVVYCTQEYVEETTVILDSGSSWVLPADADPDVIVEAWAAGAGGGDGNSTGGGGGGGGAYAKDTLTLTPGNSYSYSIGSGGPGASSGSTAAGTAGGDTSFNSGAVLAKGGNPGAGGTSNNPAGGAGGLASASVGSTKYNGGTGGNGNNTGDLGGGGGEGASSNAAGTNGSGQTGGSSVNDGGDGGNGGGNAGAGSAGSIPGGGGGGGENGGGAGAQGRLRLTYTVTSPRKGEMHIKYTGVLSSSVDTTIQIHADGVSSDYAPTDTYGARNAYPNTTSVYHFQTESTPDVMGNNAPTKVGSPTTLFGKMGGRAVNFANPTSGTASDYYTTPMAGFGTADFSVSCLVNFDAFDAGGNVFVCNEENGSTGRPNFRMLAAPSFRQTTYASSATGYEAADAGSMSTGTWYHVAVTRVGNTVKMFVDGALIDSDTQGSTIDIGTQNNFQIGRRFNSNYGANLPFDGKMDELRIRNVGLSDDWIETEYNNQFDTSTFYTVTGPSAIYYETVTAGIIAGAIAVSGIKKTITAISECIVQAIKKIGHQESTSTEALVSVEYRNIFVVLVEAFVNCASTITYSLRWGVTESVTFVAAVTAQKTKNILRTISVTLDASATVAKSVTKTATANMIVAAAITSRLIFYVVETALSIASSTMSKRLGIYRTIVANIAAAGRAIVSFYTQKYPSRGDTYTHSYQKKNDDYTRKY